jgi:hypothetical protein
MTNRNNHLTEKEIFSLILNPEDVGGGVYAHLEKCNLCQGRVKKLSDFTEAFQKHVKQDDIDWVLEKQKILASSSRQDKPSFIKWKWAAASVFSILILVSLLFFNHPKHDNDLLVSETDLLTEIQVVTDFKGNNKLPESVLYLSGNEPEESSGFLNLFSIIEEEYNEKENITDDIFGAISYKFLRCV